MIGSSTNDVVATSKEENDDAAVASIMAGFGSVLNVSSLHQQSPERKKTKDEKPVQEKEADGAPAPPPPPLPESDKDEEKKRKAEEKERRRQEHLARMASEGKPEPKLQKAASKAERRAQQEAQRAAKEQEKSKRRRLRRRRSKRRVVATTTTTTTTSKGGSAPSGSGDKSASTVGGGSTDETHRSFTDVRTNNAQRFALLRRISRTSICIKRPRQIKSTTI